MFRKDQLHEVRVLSGIRPTRPSLTEARSGITAHERGAQRQAFLFESFKPGDFWFQRFRNGEEIWFAPLATQKNGGVKGLLLNVGTRKVKNSSVGRMDIAGRSGALWKKGEPSSKIKGYFQAHPNFEGAMGEGKHRGAGAPVKLKDQLKDAEKRARLYPKSGWKKHAAKLRAKLKGEDLDEAAWSDVKRMKAQIAKITGVADRQVSAVMSFDRLTRIEVKGLSLDADALHRVTARLKRRIPSMKVMSDRGQIFLTPRGSMGEAAERLSESTDQIVKDLAKLIKQARSQFAQVLVSPKKVKDAESEMRSRVRLLAAGAKVSLKQQREIVRKAMEQADPKLAKEFYGILDGYKPPKKKKRPTFQKAGEAIRAYLKDQGWTIQTRNQHSGASLKFPYAVDPRGHSRVWFKKQAVYLGKNRPGANINQARSLHMDIRDMSPEEFFQDLKDWMR